MDKLLSLLGLALRAGRLEAGDEAVSDLAEAHRARLILLSADASAHTARRAEFLSGETGCLLVRLPATKEQLGRALGRGSCAIAALTDIGFAEAAGKRLAALDEAQYGAVAERLSLKARRAAERRNRKPDTGAGKNGTRSGKANDRPAGGNPAKPRDRKPGKSYDRPAGGNPAKPRDRKPGKSYDRPAGGNSAKPRDRKPGKSYDRPAGRNSAKPRDRAPGKSYKKPIGRNSAGPAHGKPGKSHRRPAGLSGGEKRFDRSNH